MIYPRGYNSTPKMDDPAAGNDQSIPQKLVGRSIRFQQDRHLGFCGIESAIRLEDIDRLHSWGCGDCRKRFPSLQYTACNKEVELLDQMHRSLETCDLGQDPIWKDS
jgi:hypothetical protein